MSHEVQMEDIKDLLKYLSQEELGKIVQAMEEMFTSLKSDQEWKGHVFMPGFSPEVAEFVYNNYEPTDKDVFIASYPKTGKMNVSKLVFKKEMLLYLQLNAVNWRE